MAYVDPQALRTREMRAVTSIADDLVSRGLFASSDEAQQVAETCTVSYRNGREGWW